VLFVFSCIASLLRVIIESDMSTKHPWSTSCCLLSLLLATPCLRAQAEALAPRLGQTRFFVATNGNDRWSGALPAPKPDGSDGPFATPERALKATRELKQQSPNPKRTLTVCVRGGSYFLDQPLALMPEDSGLILTAYPGETPILSGGLPVIGWREITLDGKPLWAAELPAARGGKWPFHELWVNGQRAVRARQPNKGYLAVAELPDKSTNWTTGQSAFRFREGDLKAWATVTNAEVVVMTKWVESRLPVLAVDEKERLVRFAKRSVFSLEPGDLYYAEGALDFLDQPGEWCLDPAAGTLYYWPRPGETIDRVHAVAPVLAQVLRLEGRPQTGQLLARIFHSPPDLPRFRGFFGDKSGRAARFCPYGN